MTLDVSINRRPARNVVTDSFSAEHRKPLVVKRNNGDFILSPRKLINMKYIDQIIQPPGATGAAEGYKFIRNSINANYPRLVFQEFERRYAKIRLAMSEQNLDALLMYAGGFNLGNQKAINFWTEPNSSSFAKETPAKVGVVAAISSMISLGCVVIHRESPWHGR